MIIGLASFVLWIAIGDDENFPNRVHQHQQGNSESTTVLDFTEMKTDLPVISMETGGQRIPGTPIINNKDYYYQLSEQGESEIKTAFTLYQENMEPLKLSAMIHYRGHSSRFFDKKSYALRFIDEDNNDKDTSLLGMESDNNWALHGPYLDRSLIRNYMAMNLAGEIMPFAPDVRFVEVFLDHSYEGLYLVMEKVSKGVGRVPIATPEKNSQQTDYLVLVDRPKKMNATLDDFLMDTYKVYPSGTEINYPTNTQYTEERQQFVNQDFSFIAHSIYQIPYADEENQYRKLLNVQAFYDYFIINELFRNVDAGHYSTYFYRDLRGGLTPVVWDFNNSLNNYQVITFDASGFSLTQSIFYEQLLKDQAFVDGLIRRYHHLRKTKLQTERLQQYVDDTIDFLGEAVERNNNRWGDVYDLNHYDQDNHLQPSERNYTSYQEAVDQVKDYLEKRGDWLDTNIDTLYQYSHPSRHSHESIK
ncbi:CotH protein [Saliterribacillus persicus]|uniref:CotH protein n=2 Tax=Saliterribacillus persicus TaxID=930114 RepID=A0A368Y9V7_9BACI|nr:CotH protein [Saliterribacillus persicus]